jgi:uncharacterized damage-inducible protein DinB
MFSGSRHRSVAVASKSRGSKGRKAASKQPAAKKSAARKPPARRPAPAAASAHQKRELADAFRREHEKTLKVLRALPADQAELRPHPRLKTARELAYVFLIEQSMLKRALMGEPIFAGGGPPPAPQDLHTIIDQLERGCSDIESLIGRLGDDVLQETIKFPVGPGPNGPTMGDWSKQAFAWFMLSDHIHHRGQMSVYLRIAGGKVPAIYGPSGDEPWR